MQFLHQLEDAYGFKGYMHIDPSLRGKESKTIFGTNSKAMLNYEGLGNNAIQLEKMSPYPIIKRNKKTSLFETDLSSFM